MIKDVLFGKSIVLFHLKRKKNAIGQKGYLPYFTYFGILDPLKLIKKAIVENEEAEKMGKLMEEITKGSPGPKDVHQN